MKHLLLVIAAAAALAGCSSWRAPITSASELSHGSWLDRVGVPPPVGSVQLPQDQAAALRSEAAQLKAQAETVRVKLASETDRVRRIEYLRELQSIGDRLRPIEHTLRWGA